MAEYWVDSQAPAGGSGTEASPFNTVASGALGSNTWNFRRGRVFDFAAQALSTGNNTTLRAYGDVTLPKPILKGSASNLLASTTASGAIVLQDIELVRDGTQAGNGIDATLMNGTGASFTMQRCKVGPGFNTCLRLERTRLAILEENEFVGTLTTYGVRGQAHAGNNCDNWIIEGNSFNCGTDLELYVSSATLTLGSFNNLRIKDNLFSYNGSTPGGTSIFLRGYGNATDYTAQASINAGQLIREASSPVWPNWSIGTVLFLAGWENVANFGTVTVTGGGNTRNVTFTDLGATTQNEDIGIGKGCAVRDVARAFVNLQMIGNTIRNRGLTPVFLDNLIGGVVEGNSIENTNATGQVAAALEAYNCLYTTFRYNTISRMVGPVSVDSMGIFLDGACQGCTAYGNYATGIYPTPVNSNAGAGLAAFFCMDCVFHSNVVEDCLNGVWVGGTATRVVSYLNTVSDCTTGLLVNSSPQAGAVEFYDNVITGCGIGIRDSSSATVSNNAWWRNTVDNYFGTLAAKDAAAITEDPMLGDDLRPVAGSSLEEAGTARPPSLDKTQILRRLPRPTVGALEIINQE